MSLSHHDFDIADRLCGHVSMPEENFETPVRIARTLDELRAAYRLVYREYLMRGFCQPDESKMHYTFYCLLPGTRTFVLKKNEKVLGTVTLITDSECGLPLESSFADEIEGLRSPQRCIAEISLLALDRNFIQEKDLRLAGFRKLWAVFALFKVMFDYVRVTSITDFVIAVHPRQESLYKSLDFETIGPRRCYLPACGNPAVAMHLNITQWLEITPQEKSTKSYFLRESPGECFENCYEWSAGAIREFFQGKKISHRAKEYLQLHYPEIGFSEARPDRPCRRQVVSAA